MENGTLSCAAWESAQKRPASHIQERRTTPRAPSSRSLFDESRERTVS